MKILILSLISLNLWAQNPLSGVPDAHDPRPPVLRHDTGGNLFAVKLIPGKKQLSFEIVGTPAAKVTFNKVTAEAILNFGEKESRVSLNRKKNIFILPQYYRGPLQLNVKDTDSGKTEKFDFDVKP